MWGPRTLNADDDDDDETIEYHIVTSVGERLSFKTITLR